MTVPVPAGAGGVDARCGYTVVDGDGIEQPCGRPATGWRWYQDVSHEDCLDVACDLHENEGGRRLAAAEQRADTAEAESAERDHRAYEHGKEIGRVSMMGRVERAKQRADTLAAERDEAVEKLAALRRHTLDRDPALRQLHDTAVQYHDIVSAYSEVTGGAPLSTTIGWLIRSGFLAPASPTPGEIADNFRRLAALSSRPVQPESGKR